MSEPLVSIITPAFNAAAHIEATARSVLDQTFGQWEWIIADDGSTDGTRDLVRRIDDRRIQLIECEHSGLPAVARNRALAHAHAPLIAYLDADDLWSPDKLTAQIECLERYPDAGLVFSKVTYFFADTGRAGRRPQPSMDGIPNPGWMFVPLCIRNRVCASSAVVRRALLNAHGAMDEDPRQRGTEDYELWLRLAAHTRFAWIDRALVQYRVDPRSLSGNAVNLAHGTILAVEKNLRRYPDCSPFTRRGLEAWKLFRLGHGQFQNGVERSGRRALWQSLRISPFHLAGWLWLALSFLSPAIRGRLRRVAVRLF